MELEGFDVTDEEGEGEKIIEVELDCTCKVCFEVTEDVHSCTRCGCFVCKSCAETTELCPSCGFKSNLKHCEIAQILLARNKNKIDLKKTRVRIRPDFSQITVLSLEKQGLEKIFESLAVCVQL